MSVAIEQRERIRVRELARQYEKSGYEVTVPVRKSQVPPFLREQNYIPDLILRSKDENLIVEVKSSEGIRHNQRLAEIARLIDRNKDWSFLLVLTNPKPGEPKPAARVLRPRLAVKKAEQVAASVPQAQLDVALVYWWTALEAALASNARKARKPRVLGLSMVRDAVIEGLLPRSSYVKLRRLFDKRNASLHGPRAPKVSKKEVNWLESLVRDLLAN